jgi:hypothetical protein
MRQFQDKDWEYTVHHFEKLAKVIPWVVRFRLTYYSDRKRHVSARIKMFAVYWLQWIQFYWKCWKPIFIPSNKDIKAATYLILLDTNNAYLNCLLPIVAAIANESKSTYQLFIPSEKMASILPKLEMHSIPLTDIITELDLPIKNRIAKLFACKIYAIYDLIRLTTYFPLQSWHYMWAFLKFSFQQHLFENTINQVVAKQKYLIGASDQWFWDSPFYLAAQKSNCLSIIVQHGLIGEFCYPMLTKKYAVWGANDALLMIEKYGTSTNEITVMGSPYFDQFKLNWKSLSSEKSTFEAPYITFFAQPYFKYNYLGKNKYLEVVNWYLGMGALFASYQKKGLIKFHPLDNRQDYPNMPANFTSSEDNLKAVLANTCIAITVDSAVTYECIMAGIPVLQLSNNYLRFVDLSGNGFTKIITNPLELEQTIQDLLQDKNSYLSIQKEAQKASANFLENQEQSVTKFLQIFS